MSGDRLGSCCARPVLGDGGGVGRGCVVGVRELVNCHWVRRAARSQSPRVLRSAGWPRRWWWSSTSWKPEVHPIDRKGGVPADEGGGGPAQARMHRLERRSFGGAGDD
eukprot:15064834-Alexandrium_andersonii.AAC.1